MGSIDNFAWSEVSPGRWERDTDEIENFYLALDRQYAETGRHYFAIMGHISVSVEVPSSRRPEECEDRLELALQAAWVRLRFDHPTIASWVEYTGRQPRKVYECGGPYPSRKDYLKIWLDSTFRSISTDKTGLEWCNADPPVPKLPTLFLLKTPESLANGLKRQIVRRDLVLRAPHDIIDGIGTLLFFNNFLKHAAEAYSSSNNNPPPAWGSEHHNLSPSFRIAASLPNAISPQQLARIEDITASNAALRRDLPTLSIPFNAISPTPGKHQRASLTLPSDQTALILAACRARSLTVTQAYHTAIAMAVRDSHKPSQQPTPTLKRYINYSLINERRHCKHPYNTPSHAAAVYHSTSGAHLALDLEVPGMLSSSSPRTPEDDKADFARLAPIVRDYYTSIRNDASHPPLVPHYFTLATPKDPRIKDSSPSNPPPLPPPNETPSVSISSFGRMDDLISAKYGGVLEVGDPWVTGEELGTGLGVFLGTFGGELGLSAAFNEAFHTESEVRGFLERLQEIVTCVLDC